MAKEVYIPKFGQTVEEVTIVNFLVEDGASVSEGDEIMEVETDKAIFSVEAEIDGVVHFAPFKVGEVVPILTVVAIIGKEGDVFSSGAASAEVAALQEDEKPAPEPVKAPTPQPEIAQAPEGRRFISPRARKLAAQNDVDIFALSATGAGGTRILERDVIQYLQYLQQLPSATPLARRVAQQNKVDLTQLAPTGPGGKITREEVEEYLEHHQDASGTGGITQDQPMTGIRRLIAEKMLESSQQTAPVTLFMDADATPMVELRQQMKAAAPDGKAPGFNEIIAKISANTMEAFPFMNARIVENRIQWLGDVHIGIAVDTERGLVVPVVKHVDRLNVVAIAREFQRLLDAIRSSKVNPDDLAGSTFTITNLGGFDVRAFTPIINLPEAAILALGKIEDRLVPATDGIRVRKMMTLSLTFDHRLVDGAPAARFLQAVKNGIEQIKPEDLE